MRKGGKVKESEAKGQKRTRSTNIEICIKLNKERSKIYYERKKLSAKLVSVGAGSSKYRALEVANDKLSDKLLTVNSKLFKCGKRYAKLKARKLKLQKLRSKLSIELKDVSDMSPVEIVKKSKELYKTTVEIDSLDSLMKMRLIGVTRGGSEQVSVSFDKVDLATFEETVNLWDLKDSVSDKVDSGLYKSVEIGGVVYDIKTQSFEVFSLLTSMVSDYDSLRREGKRTGTPVVGISSSLISGEISVSDIF